MTAPVEADTETLTEHEGPAQEAEAPPPRGKAKKSKGDPVTAEDWAAAVTGEIDLPTVDPTASTAAPAEQKTEKRTGALAWLADASHWLPHDEDAVNIPSIQDLTEDYRAHVNKSSSGIVRFGGQCYAVGTLLAGYALNLVSLALAATSTCLNRMFVSKEAWNREDGRRMRPRSLATLSTDNAATAAVIENRWLRAHYTFAAGTARRVSQVLNPIAHDIAWIAAGMNSPRRLVDALCVAVTVTAVVTGIWWMAGA